VRPDAADDDPEVRILVNTNVSMSRHKAAAQAVHAALAAFGIPHGRVVVLGGRPDEVAAMDVVVRDAGRTEVAPGTLTAGAALVRRREDDGSGHPGGTDPG
jgi:PTH2 family peptidyl-tRNA hydrolase